MFDRDNFLGPNFIRKS